MFLSDSKMASLGAGLIEPFRTEHVGPVSYDLTAKTFCRMVDGKASEVEHVTLKPLESIFVSCEEIIHVPANMAGIINIRNSKLRQGLSVESPIYFPGHQTRVFFRLTNISNASIDLAAGDSYAAIFFSTVDGEVQSLYHGTFADEFDFRGMAGYTDQYAEAMHAVEEKTKDLKSLEHGIYANVIVFMTIFVALFTIININVNLVRDSTGAATLYRMLVFNLGTVGSIAALIAFAQSMFREKKMDKKPLVVSGIYFAAALFFSSWV